MRIGTRLFIAAVSGAAALTLSVGTASAATTSASAPAAAAASVHEAAATAGTIAAPASIREIRNYRILASEEDCELEGSVLIGSIVDGGEVVDYECSDEEPGGWALDLFVSPLNCSAVVGQSEAAQPAAKCA